MGINEYIFECPIELTEVAKVGCLSATMCAGIGARIYKDTFDAVDKCIHIKEFFTPNLDNQEIYQKTFDK